MASILASTLLLTSIANFRIARKQFRERPLLALSCLAHAATSLIALVRLLVADTWDDCIALGTFSVVVILSRWRDARKMRPALCFHMALLALIYFSRSIKTICDLIVGGYD